MKAFLILEDGTVFEGTSIGSTREVISEIVFNTSMTGYLEVLTDPSYAGQAVTMTYPLITECAIRIWNPRKHGQMDILFVSFPEWQATSEMKILSRNSFLIMISQVFVGLTQEPLLRY